MNVFWFRRDLRLEDNVGLYKALYNQEPLLPIFIFDPYILSQLLPNDARISFIHKLLVALQKQFNAQNKSLAVFYGSPLQVFKNLIQNHQIKFVYANHDYEPYAIQRDAEIFTLLKQHAICFKTYKDQVIFEKDDLIKDNKTPYVVYTPYMKKWKASFNSAMIEEHKSHELIHHIVEHDYPFLNLSHIGFQKSSIEVLPFDISNHLISNYDITRNIPALSGTSLLAPYLRFGAISIRTVMAKAMSTDKDTFCNELLWREFFMQILWHFPKTVTSSFYPKYDKIQWLTNEVDFEKWCKGITGYPFVDAGMRALNATGYMHNRVRMVAASFLCKHLLIDWRWGEAYFAQKLLDYEQASNVGNWQWVAGTGVDAAPYFRIFNPMEQLKKFDKNFEYIKKWVPEYQDLEYRPMIDHKEARMRALTVYKEALKDI